MGLCRFSTLILEKFKKYMKRGKDIWGLDKKLKIGL